MAKTESQKLSVLADIGRIISQSHDVEETLNNIVRVVSERMHADVCSIYLLSQEEGLLTLRATVGLDAESVGKVQMRTYEGLTGLVVQRMKPVSEREARQSPRFKFFPETHEEEFQSYLGVPLVERRNPVGVLAIQTKAPRDFTADEIRMFEALASQVTGLITSTQMLSHLEEVVDHQRQLEDALRKYEKEAGEKDRPREERVRSQVLRGLPASPGFGMGYVHLHQHEFHLGAGYAEHADDVTAEKERLHEAFEKSILEVGDLKVQITGKLSEEDSSIFHGHFLMLEDKGFRQRIEEVINEGRRAEFALEIVAQLYKDQFSKFDDPYLKERVIDVEDVERRLLRNLLGIEREQKEFDEESVVVADDISPSELIYMDSPKLMGLVLSKGGVTSHVSILGKSMDLPSVVGVETVLSEVVPGDFIIVDGNAGTVYINPAQRVIQEYIRLQAAHQTLVVELKDTRELLAETLDGKHVPLEANIGLHSEIPLCLEQGAEGIGLYRTEFPYLSRPDFPTEEEQVGILVRAQEAMSKGKLTVRTFDIGGEKMPKYFPVPEEHNPLLGWRSLRLALDETQILETQIRAIVRAARDDRLRVMFPMVSDLDELRKACDIFTRVKKELGVRARIEVGIMVEVPSASVLATRLAKEVDFFAIGTNDLIQYILAVDRNNPMVSDRYQEFHPAVLAEIHRIISAAKEENIRVSVCGEMAGAAASAIVLVGMGVDSLSMTLNAIPFVKRVIRKIHLSKARKLVDRLLELDTTAEVKEHLRKTYKKWGLGDLVEVRDN